MAKKPSKKRAGKHANPVLAIITVDHKGHSGVEVAIGRRGWVGSGYWFQVNRLKGVASENVYHSSKEYTSFEKAFKGALNVLAKNQDKFCLHPRDWKEGEDHVKEV